MRFSSVIRSRLSSGPKNGTRAKVPAQQTKSLLPLPPEPSASALENKAVALTDSGTTSDTNRNDYSSTTVTDNISTVKSTQMSPSSCTVLIVDKRFLKGVYYTASSGSTTMRGGPARDDVVFVQELLEIYGQVVAVLSGDTALRWIFNHTGNKAIIVLIDVDETYDRTQDDDNSDNGNILFHGPIYTPPSSPQEQQQNSRSQYHRQNGGDSSNDLDSHDSDSGPYGLALLRVIAHYVAIGVFRNVAPIASTADRKPSDNYARMHAPHLSSVLPP
ncbi:hypothetical protein BX070DRAFT_254862 [Coemansia spiralis]|nr:hypothetical protein BX070DRAFT_254862 [Coemansia spiralis]